MPPRKCLLLLIACGGLAACTPCDRDITLHLKFPEALRNADQIDVAVSADDTSGSPAGTVMASHPLGQTEGEVRVPLAKYPAGTRLLVSVRAISRGKLLATATRTTTLTGSCGGSLDVDLAFSDTNVRLAANLQNKVDLLFMIDDSPGMSAKQTELKARFPELVKILDDSGKANPISYHLGVVTSDMGAGAFTLGSGQCHPGGRGGKLQALGGSADASCQTPGGGVSFIDYDQVASTNNLPTGQSFATTFACMASVGDKGCGFEQPLEAVYTALHDPPAENHDFLRPDAQLVVVFLTDEDDCSAPADSDLFDPAMTAYGRNSSYRCTQYGIECVDPSDGQLKAMPPGSTGGTWQGCVSLPTASGGKLIDVDKYITLLTRPASQGGVKVDPDDVLIAGITAASSGGVSSIIQSTTMLGGSCPAPSDTCVTTLQPSCISPSNSQFTGEPAVRLNQVINAGQRHQLTSICDTSYQSALQSLGLQIVAQLGPCLWAPLADPSAPDCTVEDVIPTSNGSSTTTPIPRCSGGDTQSCWQLDLAYCANQVICANAGDPGQHFSISIHRNGGQPPAGTSVRASCRTLNVILDSNGSPPQCGAPL